MTTTTEDAVTVTWRVGTRATHTEFALPLDEGRSENAVLGDVRLSVDTDAAAWDVTADIHVECPASFTAEQVALAVMTHLKRVHSPFRVDTEPVLARPVPSMNTAELTVAIREHLATAPQRTWQDDAAAEAPIARRFGELVKHAAVAAGVDARMVARFGDPFTSENGDDDWQWPLTAYPDDRDEALLFPWLLDLGAAPVAEQVQFALQQMLKG